MTTRGFLYWLARFLGDISAIKKRKVKKRIGRRIKGRIASHFITRF